MPARLLPFLLAFSWLGTIVALPPLVRRQDSSGIEVTSGIRTRSSLPATGATSAPATTPTDTTHETVAVVLSPDTSFWSNGPMVAGVFTTVAIFLVLTIGAGFLFLRGAACCRRVQSEKPAKRRSFFRPTSLLPIPRPVLLPIDGTRRQVEEPRRSPPTPRQGPSRPATGQSAATTDLPRPPSVADKILPSRRTRGASDDEHTRASFHHLGTEYGWLEPLPQAPQRRRSDSDPQGRRQPTTSRRPHTADETRHAPSAYSERHRAGTPQRPTGPRPARLQPVQNGPSTEPPSASSSRTVTFARQTAIKVIPPPQPVPSQIMTPASERTVVGHDDDPFDDLPPTLPLRIIRSSPGLSPSNSALSTTSTASTTTVVAKFPLPPSTSPTVYSPSSPLGTQPPVTTPVAYNGPFRAMAPRGNVRPGTPQEVVREWMRAASAPSPQGTEVGQAQVPRGRSPGLNLVIPPVPSATPSSSDGSVYDLDRS